jgi:hypothetical protein
MRIEVAAETSSEEHPHLETGWKEKNVKKETFKRRVCI